MDGQNTIDDLPTPTRRPLDPEEKRRRHWKLIATIAWAIAAYASLHKFFLPLALSFTPLAKTPFAFVDYWFLHPVLLAFLISKSERNSPAISFLSGAAISYGIMESILVAQGYYIGWLSVSRSLSSIPMAILAAYLMTQLRFLPRYGIAWIGAFVVALALLPKVIAPPTSGLPTPTPSVVSVERNEGGQTFAQHNAMLCGAHELKLTPESAESPNPTLQISSCGFFPAFINLSNHKISISNELDTTVNIHLVLSDKGKHRSVWNFPIGPRQKADSPAITVPAGEVGMLYSDNFPKLGLTAVRIPKDPKSWLFTRTPIHIRSLP